MYSLKILSGTLPTRLNESRGGTIQSLKLCRWCRSTAETDLHVLNECRRSKKLISARHNKICDKLGKELKNSNLNDTIQRERCHYINLKRYQPDITWTNENGRIILIEVTVPYETSDERLAKREEEKVRYYTPPINAGLAHEIVAIAIGSAGTINKNTCNKIKQLTNAKTVKHLQMISLNESANVAANHFKNQ